MMRPSDQLRGNQGYTIAVTPTADMPAPVSEVTVSGEIRVRALYRTYEVDGDSIDVDADDASDLPFEETNFESNDFDITTRARLRVDGKTETARFVSKAPAMVRAMSSATILIPMSM
jgi:hypothetical protein